MMRDTVVEHYNILLRARPILSGPLRKANIFRCACVFVCDPSHHLHYCVVCRGVKLKYDAEKVCDKGGRHIGGHHG
jgi:hypothetical protein